MTKMVWLIPHTHWDREWYEPFQQFRLRLVDLMDDVVTRATHEPGFRFTMDGQMAAVEDYLEVRPEQRDHVRRLVERGQLAIGPWRVLMDEFLCSGETMLRNLETGWADAAKLGPVMPVGYLPDMFGHCAQMPQILSHVGIDRAVVYRGVLASLGRNEFWWQSPDGTRVRTEFLANSYGNAADVFGHGGDARTRLDQRVGEQDGWYHGGDFLALYGTDHAAPLPTLMGEVDALNADGGMPVRVATLTEYLELAAAPGADLPVLEGELRSHARANILPGVLSVRWQLKEAMARTERLLTRYAEPFASLWLPTLPAYYLDLAWRNVIDSSCHDSVTGCGVDETATQVLARLQEAEHAARAVRDRALAPARTATPRGALVVANPLARERHDLVEVTVPVPSGWGAVGFELPDGTVVLAQDLGRPEQELARERVATKDLPRLMHRVHDSELFGLEVLELVVDEASRTVVFRLADHGDPDFDAISAELALRSAVGAEVGTDDDDPTAAAAAADDDAWEVLTIDEPRRCLAARLPVPALGWAAVRAVQTRPHSSPGETILQGDRRLDNGIIDVTVDDDGTLTITADGVTLSGVGRLVDGGDCGDSYNYGPPATDRLLDTPERVTITPMSTTGAVVGRLRVERLYALPTSSDARGRSDISEPTMVVTDVEVRAGEPFVRLDLAWQNRSRDHRLRLHVPTASTADHSYAQGQLAVVKRGRIAEGGPVGEHPLPTFPAETFVDAGGAGVLLGRSVEYEVVDAADGGTEIALTLLRAIGYLSRNVHPLRSEPAGPQLATPDAQVLMPATASLAVAPHRGSWADAGLGRLAEEALHPVVITSGTGTADLTMTSTEGLRVASEGVDVLSVRRRTHDDLTDDDLTVEVRLLNSSDAPATATLGSERVPVLTATAVNGRGKQLQKLDIIDRRVRIPLKPWEIATVRVALNPLSG
ncbi:MAG: hypothetical protein ABI336_05395 [Humibacillus sp.]